MSRLKEYTRVHGYVVLVTYSEGDEPYVLTNREGLPFGKTYANRLLSKQLKQGYKAGIKRQRITLVDMEVNHE